MPRGIYERKSIPIEARFWAKVQKSAGCWNWISPAVDVHGYGLIAGNRRKLFKAHRVSWEIHRGPIPDGLWVLHRCDNRRCVNPDHLFLGTAADNSADMIAKDREARGEAHPAAKLSSAEVKAIRQLCNDGELSQRRIGALYGVHQVTISKIARGKRWRKEAA